MNQRDGLQKERDQLREQGYRLRAKMLEMKGEVEGTAAPKERAIKFGRETQARGATFS